MKNAKRWRPLHLKSIKPINFDHVRDVEKSLRAFCIIMSPCISFCFKGALLKFQEPLLFPTEYCAILINDVNITEFIRDIGNTIVWILCQKHMATLMRAPPVSFLQNLTQIWSQMIAAHHIYSIQALWCTCTLCHLRFVCIMELSKSRKLRGKNSCLAEENIWNDVGKEDLRWTFETCGEITYWAWTASGKTLSGDDLRRWVNISTALSNLRTEADMETKLTRNILCNFKRTSLQKCKTQTC